MKGSGIIASHSMSPLSKITNLKNTSQFNLLKDSNSTRVKDLLKHRTIPLILCVNLLTFRDTGKVFEIKGDLLRVITN